MQPERLEKVKSLLALALSKPPREREAFLASACAGDPMLRREIDNYLGIGDKTDQFSYNADTVPDAQISLESLPPTVIVQVPADPRIGRQFGKYTIRSRVAEGGMGIVYLALDTQLGREVALKILPEYFSMDRERLARFHREARAISLLNHPNIVTVFEIGQVDGCEYIVTEFVEGKTVRELMQQGQIPFVEMLKIASQVAGALSTAHRAGIIHRDIKPENVMVRPDGYVKVLDFGLAKLLDTTGSTPFRTLDPAPGGPNQTVPGMIMGTVAYMSPEQAEGLEIDARTDIWSLGVILHEMVARKVPFSGPTASHTIVAILERDPAELKNVSPELKHIISTALQKDRALRFQTAEAMAAALRELRHRLGAISDQNVSGPASAAGSFAVPDTAESGRSTEIPGLSPTVASIAIPSPAPTATNIALPDSAPAARETAMAAPEPAARGIEPPRPVAALPSPYRKLLWLAPAVVILLLVGTIGIYAVVTWLIDNRRNNGVIVRPDDAASPTPAPTIEVRVLRDPTPSASPPVIYVDPTPEPEPEKTRVPVDDRSKEKPVRTPVPEPRRTPVPEPTRRPVKKPTPKKDPNCVFTNSCN